MAEPANLQKLMVEFVLPSGQKVKSGVNVGSGPIHDRAKLDALLLHPHPEGTVITSIVRIGVDGQPMPGHPVTGPMLWFRAADGTPKLDKPIGDGPAK